MNRAYDEIYLEDAMTNLGTCFDFAKKSYGIRMDDFYVMFINSGIASMFETGATKYIAGKSGIETVLDVLRDYQVKYIEDYINYDYSCEYWCGWILAYIQWYFAIRFIDLRYYLKMTDLEKLYGILHEVSLKKALEVICEHIRNKKLRSRLQQLRLDNNLSQSDLASRSGVSLRMIQQYEQKKKDINKANAISLLSLAAVLNCEIENLIEWDFSIADHKRNY